MKWITRAPAVRSRCLSLADSRFIDPTPEFLFVPAPDVLLAADRTGAIPYDIVGVELGHVGEECSFDAFLHKYDLREPSLAHLAAMVRGADTGRPALTPESPGLPRSRSACRGIIETIWKCSSMGPYCTTRCTLGAAACNTNAPAGRRTRSDFTKHGRR